MNLLAITRDALDAHGVRFAVIGATALAAHGVTRTTGDLDLLVTDRRCLDVDVPIVRAADLMLLKLFAGGPQDAWDIDQLLDVVPAALTEVETSLAALPEDCRFLWRILEGR